MRKITAQEIEEYASRPEARRIAVENFLGTMGTDREVALGNLVLDARLYRWNRQTKRAISEGIALAALTKKPGELIPGPVGFSDAQCDYCFRGVSPLTLRRVQLRHQPGSREWQSPLWVCPACREHLGGFFRYAK